MCVYVCIRVCIHVCVRVCVRVCVYMCVCMKKDNFKALMGIIGTQGPTLALRGGLVKK